MKARLGVLLAVLLLATTVTPVFAWDEGVDVDRDCTNVYVTADPETVFENKVFGVYLTKWVPETVIGTGTFPWGTLQTSMNGTVTVTWRKYTRANLFSPWVATSQTHTEGKNWSTNRPGSCQITYCHVAGLGDSPANYVTLTTSINGALAHFLNNGSPKAGHELDYLGPCNPPPACEWNPDIFADDPNCVPPYEACDETGDWVEVSRSQWVFNPNTGLFEQTVSYEKYDARDGRTLCDSKQEIETRGPGSEIQYWGEADCEAWTIWGQVINEGEAPDGEPFVASSGGWVNPFVLESAEDFGVTVYEPERCLQEPGDPYTDCTGVWIFNVETQEYDLVYEWENPAEQESVVIDEVTYWEPEECVEKQCESETLGWLFHLVGPEGQTCDLASYQINPNTGRWAIPNVGAQQKCCGFVAKNIPSGREIVVGCNGKVNIICTRCVGGGPAIAYGDD